MTELVLRHGEDRELEFFAELILADDRRRYREQTKGQSGHNLVYDILSPDQLEVRTEKDKLTPLGNLDVGIQRGVYGRAWVDWPLRPTQRRHLTPAQDPWHQEWHEFIGDNIASAWFPVAYRDLVTGGQSYVPGTDRDPAWPRFGNHRDHAFLDRYQRCRIRAAMRKVRKDNAKYLLLKDVLAAKYGVPSWMISRVVGPVN